MFPRDRSVRRARRANGVLNACCLLFERLHGAADNQAALDVDECFSSGGGKERLIARDCLAVEAGKGFYDLNQACRAALLQRRSGGGWLARRKKSKRKA
jgi:hypothetical protein